MILLMEENRRSPVEVGSLTHYLQRFLHPRWCRISEPSTVKHRFLPFSMREKNIKKPDVETEQCVIFFEVVKRKLGFFLMFQLLYFLGFDK